MPKKKSTFDKYTWIVTELIIGIAALGYGLFGIIDRPTITNYFFIILVSSGSILLLVAIVQIIMMRKKKIDKFCSKCGEKIKKADDYCPKCGEKIG